MTPFPHPYHTVMGNSLTVYLDLVSDTDSQLGNAIDNVLAQLAMQWGPIATASGLTLTFAFSSTTPPPMNPIPPGINVVMGATPSGNVQFFTFTIGRGASADPPTRSARISYVNYRGAKGYIYEIPLQPPTFVPHISHELGHVLGLSDRYYEAIYWLENRAMNRTCQQIRRSLYDVPPNDFRDGQPDPGPVFNQLPRLAVRASLPMAAMMVPSDTQYVPASNLMSTRASTLTATQINLIRSQGEETTYRTVNWVAILGDWKTYAAAPNNIPAGASGSLLDFPTADNFHDLSKWLYPAWEARPQDGGRGLLFLPPGHNAPFRYGCLKRFGKAKASDGAAIHLTRIAAARGKTRVFAFGGITYNVIGMNVVHPNWMCHVRRMIRDLL